MHEGWLMATDAERWTYRFHRDDKSWTRDPKVFVYVGRPMPDVSHDFLMLRKHLRREKAEGMWKDLLSKGWKKVPPAWGPESPEP